MSTTLASKAPAETAAEPAGGGKTKLIGIVIVVIALAAAGWYFFLRPKPESAPKPGEVVKLEPIQVNLASGHYLRLGMALQLTESAHEADGSKALDAAITIFSGLPVGEVNKPAERDHLKEELHKELEHLYHGDVMDVYFTEYVTQ